MVNIVTNHSENTTHSQSDQARDPSDERPVFSIWKPTAQGKSRQSYCSTQFTCLALSITSSSFWTFWLLQTPYRVLHKNSIRKESPEARPPRQTESDELKLEFLTVSILRSIRFIPPFDFRKYHSLWDPRRLDIVLGNSRSARVHPAN